MVKSQVKSGEEFPYTEELWELDKFISSLGGREITPEKAFKEVKKQARFKKITKENVIDICKKHNKDGIYFYAGSVIEIQRLRKTQKSTCGFFVSRDVKRTTDFRRMLIRTAKNPKNNWLVLELNLFNGFHTDGWTDSNGNEVIQAGTKTFGLGSEDCFDAHPVSPLTNAFTHLEMQLNTIMDLANENPEGIPSKTWILINGIAQFPDGRTNTDELIQFINYNLLSDGLFQIEATVVVETESLEIFGENIIGNTWHHKPPISTKFEREFVIKYALSQLQELKSANISWEKFQTIVENTAGINLNSTQAIITEVILALKNEPIEIIDILDKKKELIDGIHGLKAPSESEIQKYGFDKLGGYEYLKKMVRDNIIKVLKNRKMAKELKMEVPKGLLLFGPPGTGKTLFAKSLAKELEMMFIELNWGALKNRFVGTSEERMRIALDTIDAMGERVILFIDEIDGIAGRMGSLESGGVNEQMFSSVLSWLGDKERKCLIIGTTNVPHLLAPAFIRSGRFDYKSYMGFPDINARAEIFKVHLDYGRDDEKFEPKMKKVKKEKVFIEFGEMTPYFVGSDIEATCKEARKFAFKRIQATGAAVNIKVEDVKKAIEDRMIDTPQRKDDEKRHIEMAKKFTDSKQLYDVLDGNGGKKENPPEEPEKKAGKFVRKDKNGDLLY